MSKHTPGPWKVIPSIHGDRYACVQYGYDENYTSLELLPFDAMLTAAAPKLLSALIHVEQAYTNRHSPQHRSAALCIARAAITEATGESQ